MLFFFDLQAKILTDMGDLSDVLKNKTIIEKLLVLSHVSPLRHGSFIDSSNHSRETTEQEDEVEVVTISGTVGENVDHEEEETEKPRNRETGELLADDGKQSASKKERDIEESRKVLLEKQKESEEKKKIDLDEQEDQTGFSQALATRNDEQTSSDEGIYVSN
jgi:vacuolar-type H+-ATPase subunit I/STV1